MPLQLKPVRQENAQMKTREQMEVQLILPTQDRSTSSERVDWEPDVKRIQRPAPLRVKSTTATGVSTTKLTYKNARGTKRINY